MMEEVRVLIVDDNYSKRESYKAFLEEFGYEVDAVEDSQSALDRVRDSAGGYSFVFMDQVLGPKSNLDGIETTKLIHDELPGLRVIVFTEYGDREASHKALESGAYRYIFAPFEPREMVDIMESTDHLRELEWQLTQEHPERSWLNNLLMESGIGISIIDRTYRILYANKTQLEISAPGVRIGGICWVEYNYALRQREPCSWCPVKESFKTGEPCLRMTISFKVDRPHYYDVLATPIWNESHSKIIGAVEMVIDVTEREEREELILRAVDRDMRLNAVMDYIITLGYRRARLYELSSDAEYLKGVIERGGDIEDFARIVLPLREEPFSRLTLNSTDPVIHRPRRGVPDLHQKELRREGIKEWLDVPIRVEDVPVGKISIDNLGTDPLPPGAERPEPEPLTDRDFTKLMQLAEYAGTAIIEGWREELIAREAKQLEKLREMDAELAVARNLKADLKTIAKHARDLTGASSGHIRHLEDDMLVVRAGFGTYTRRARRRLPLDDSIESGSPKAYITKKPYVVTEAQETEHYREFIARVSRRGKNGPADAEELRRIRSFGCFPLIIDYGTDQRIVGVLSLQSDRPDFFDPEMRKLIDDLCRRAAIAIHTDELLDELKNAVNQLRINEKQRIELFNRVAHSLKLPLHILDGFIDRLLSGKDKSEEEKLRDYKAIYRQVKHFERNVDDMLNLVRGEEQRLQEVVDIKKIDVRRLVVESVDLFEPRAMVKGISLGTFYDEDEDYTALADEHMTEEVIHNLLSNAISYTPARGHVSVEISSRADYICVSVADTGVGIPESEQPHIFEKLFRGGSSERMLPGGRGIGLTVSKMLMEVQNGEIAFASRIGEGTFFVIKLPSPGSS